MIIICDSHWPETFPFLGTLYCQSEEGSTQGTNYEDMGEYKLMIWKLVMMSYFYNPSTGEAEAGRSLI